MAEQNISEVDTFRKAYADFLNSAPSSYHAAAQIVEKLSGVGFVEVDEHEPWIDTNLGFVQRAGAVVAWRKPRTLQKDAGFRIVGSHTDSPSFKLKPNPNAFNYGFSQVNVEVYGGPLLNSWLNRDLGLAGLLTTIDGAQYLVKTPPIMTIPQLAPHLDRSVRQSLQLSEQQDYHPIWGIGEQDLFSYLAQNAGVAAEKIAGFDIYAYNVEPAREFGGEAGDSFFASGRQDNLSSAFASLVGFMNAPESEDVQIYVAFDHEEVGSETFTGASGPFLEQILRRLSVAAGNSEENFLRMLANSSCISADAGHSINPNQAAKHDPNHHPILGSGPMLKINANQRYATEAQGIALWLRACLESGQSTQEFVSHNDVPCGSTIGPFTASRFGIVTVDVGVPLLSMHSVREISNVNDVFALSEILRAYYAGA
ncbi:MAG: M18 family aminopeptidase [Arcanobacterium sp.]|nr:M18 family aminopeptidase [Arcanobacterium sp.]